MKTIKRPALADLVCAAIHVGSVNVDWRGLMADGNEGYTAYAGVECDGCRAFVVLLEGQGGESHRQLDGSDCDGYVPSFDGPAMSYYYDLPGYDGEALDDARKIAALPLCLIEWGPSSGRDGWALALTGGGMDLSWPICEAFMMVGYLPPLKFAGRLPRYPDLHGASRRYVLSGARKAIRVARNWLSNDARAVADLTKLVKANDAARKVQA